VKEGYAMRPPRQDGKNPRTVANNKYNAKAYDRLSVLIPKGQKEHFKQHAAARNESLNAFVNRAMKETEARDNAGGSDGSGQDPEGK
jgi:hypothetical protein